jgi:Predicted permease
MNLTRPVAFWIAVLAAVVVAVVLLREVLLPFVAGMLLAYLLDPLATRLERLGMNRLIATLTIVGLFVVGVTALIILTAPVVVVSLPISSIIFRSTSKGCRGSRPIQIGRG